MPQDAALSIAIPCLSVDPAFQYDPPRGAACALAEAARYLRRTSDGRVRVCFYGAKGEPGLEALQRFLVNPTHYRLRANGGGWSSRVHAAAGPSLEAETRAMYPRPARPGHVYPVMLKTDSPLRADQACLCWLPALVPEWNGYRIFSSPSVPTSFICLTDTYSHTHTHNTELIGFHCVFIPTVAQGVEWVLHALGPNMNPRLADAMPGDYVMGESLLRETYQSIFECLAELQAAAAAAAAAKK
ncbi:hypothetical protein PAPYR_1559 [Paratrimastix pyriformis]|uniref:Uncharacterized protein n=1 Tax=Paratrimastix pyriformis TaxID=342808 RepID=A0ABQ8URX2_9EUKA|nr:hypothetical protein PAPYR_1559 [Paratrimastix pyriformis]